MVLISQVLLVALSLSWLIHMSLIQIYGYVYFVEQNPVILWVEIAVTVIIIIFAGFVLFTQIKRLGEKRSSDRRSEFIENSRRDANNG